MEALIQAMNDLPRHLIEDKEIRSLAYRLYEDAGRPEGRVDEHWATAEEIIRSQHTSRPDRPGRIKNMFRKRKLRSSNGTFAARNAGHPASQWFLTFRR